MTTIQYMWLSSKESACRCRSHRKPRFNPWVGKIPWRRKCQPNLVYLPGKSYGQRSLAGYSAWGHKESDGTEWLNNKLLNKLSPLVFGSSSPVYSSAPADRLLPPRLPLTLCVGRGAPWSAEPCPACHSPQSSINCMWEEAWDPGMVKRVSGHFWPWHWVCAPLRVHRRVHVPSSWVPRHSSSRTGETESKTSVDKSAKISCKTTTAERRSKYSHQAIERKHAKY